MQASWAVTVTHLCQQEKVLEQLEEKGIAYFFPRISRTVRHRGRRVRRLDPLLFNYIPFVRTPGWERIFDMRGVCDVIGPVRGTEVEDLRSRCDSDGILVIPRFRPGQAVRPRDTALAGSVGKFQHERGDKLVALFSILGSMRPVEFGPDALVAA